MEFVVLLGTPVLGALLLAVWGAPARAAEINVALQPAHVPRGLRRSPRA